MKIAILESLRVPTEVIDELAQPLKDQGHELVYYEDKTEDPDELYERAKDAEIVIIANNPLPGEVIDRLDNTKYLNVAFTGVDHVDLEAAKDQGIQVSNASGYATTAVAELALGLALALLRQIPQSNQDIRAGENFEAPIQGQELAGRKVGIVGTGTIGIETAKLFKAFGCDLLAYNRSKKDEMLDLGAEYLELEDLLQEADLISIHLPLNEETRGLIGAKELDLMKETAFLINVARGLIVDEEALAQALEEGQIAGAGLDVYHQEPPLEDNNPLFKVPNTILTPHIGYLTDEAMLKRAKIAFENIDAYLKGDPKNLVE